MNKGKIDQELKDGTSILVGQIVMSSGGSPILQLVALRKSELTVFVPGLRTAAIANSRIYLFLSKMREDPDSPFSLSNSGQTRDEQENIELEELVKKGLVEMKRVWPQEYRYAKSAIKNTQIATLCMMFSASNRGLIGATNLFPEDFSGNVARIESKPSMWSREITEGAISPPPPRGSRVSVLNFTMPNFYEEI